MKLSADAYATRVARSLSRSGYAWGRAVDLVQKNERMVRAGHAQGRLALVTARHIHPRAMGPGAAAGRACAVPIEGYLMADPHDLPPMDRCRALDIGNDSARDRAGRAAGSESFYNYAFNSPQRDAMLTKVFGRTFSKAELEHAFSGAAGTVPAKAKLEQVYNSKKPRPGVADLTMKFSIHVGNHVGEMRRVFFREKDELYVYNQKFNMGEDTPAELGRGVGTSITRNSIHWYRAVGIGEIALSAAWVGRYVWATFGWNWDEEEAFKKAQELVAYTSKRVRKGLLTYNGATLAGDFRFGADGVAFNRTSRLMASRSWNLASLHMESPHPDGLPPIPGERSDGSSYHVGKPFLCGLKDEELPDQYIEGEKGATDYVAKLVLKDGHPTYERAKMRLKL